MIKRLPAVVLLFAIFIVAAVLVVRWNPAAPLNALSSSAGYTLTSIEYAPEHALSLDLYRPREPGGPRPVVVFFYGGTWNSGARADYRFLADALTARGLLVVIPDYRLYPQVRYPAFLEDCAKAVAWTLRDIERYGGDPRRVFLFGHSAGAYNAAMLALDPRWLAGQGLTPEALRGWIGLAGPYDFLPSNNLRVQPVFFHPHYPALAQPIEHVRGAAVPAFIGAASDDTLVDPQRSSVQLAQRMQAEGAQVTLRLYERVNHLTLIGAFAWPLRWLAPVQRDVCEFLLSDSTHCFDR